MNLDDASKKIDELMKQNLDEDTIKACFAAKMGLSRLKKQINLPIKTEVWNGQYSCPTCGMLFGNISDCDDNFKKTVMPRCSHCNQLLNWDFDEKSETMNLLNFKEIIDGYCETISSRENLSEVPVLINLQEPSIGAGASDPIVSAYIGFDWEDGQFRLCSKNKIIHDELSRDVSKRIQTSKYNETPSYWCPRCGGHLSTNKDKYCSHCGQKLEN